MDNIIQLIVFLFIIYSILAPILGKKKSQKAKGQVPGKYPGDVDDKTSPPTSTRDIFEEMLGFKIPKNEDEYQGPESQSSDSKDVEIASVDYDTDLKIDYKNLEAVQTIPDIDYDKLPSQESEPTELETSFTTKVIDTAIPFNNRTIAIKKLLMDTKTLRNLFLMSEIINKPKALRK